MTKTDRIAAELSTTDAMTTREAGKRAGILPADAQKAMQRLLAAERAHAVGDFSPTRYLLNPAAQREVYVPVTMVQHALRHGFPSVWDLGR